MTRLPLKERWRYHQRYAAKSIRHPFYAAIRKYGAENFCLEVLEHCVSFEEAQAAEIRHIAEHREKGRPYNVSPGGEDFRAAHARTKELWETDPAWAIEYRARLSAGVRNSDASKAHLATLPARTAAWREQNSEEAQNIMQRGLDAAQLWHVQNPEKSREIKARVSREWREQNPEAARKAGEATAAMTKRKWLQMSPEEREQHSTKRRANAKRQWAARTKADKEAVGQKIAQSLKARHAARTPEQVAVEEARLAKARESIDHTYRKQRQKEAVQAYWTPERRAEFSAKRKLSRLTTS